MYFVILIALLIFFLLLRDSISKGFSRQNEVTDRLMNEMAILKERLDQLRTGLNVTPDKPDGFTERKIADNADSVVYKSEVAPESVVDLSGIISDDDEVTQMETTERLMDVTLSGTASDEDEEIVATEEHWSPKQATFQQPKKPSFFQRHPDLEKFIGENLINKIGIAILVLGIGFFVKYAIDRDWIDAVGRMSIGILSGGLLIGIAHRLRVSFAAFSSVLIGGGLSVLYFSISIGFHDYQLLSQTAAFSVMVLITIFAVVLSLLYDRKELAVIALIGGFGTPFFVASGTGNYIVLFTYLLILNAGMLIIAIKKKWNLVNQLSYIFTVLIYGIWLAGNAGRGDVSYMGAFIFAGLFYLMFFAMNVGYNIKNKMPFGKSDIVILISNSFFFFVVGMVCLGLIQGADFRGLFTVALAIFNFVFARLIYRNSSIDRNLFYLLLGLVLTFISLAAPVQLAGNYITLFWSAELVLLLWLAQKSGIELIKKASLLVILLMLISLAMDWLALYFYQGLEPIPIILNKAFITGMVAFVAVWMYRLLLSNEKGVAFIESWRWPLNVVQLILSITTILLLYTVLLLELNYQITTRVSNYHAQVVVLGCYHVIFAAVLSFAVRRLKPEGYVWLVSLLTLALMFWWMTTINHSAIAIRSLVLFENQPFTWIFALHFIIALGLIFLVYRSYLKCRLLMVQMEKSYTPFVWIGAGLLVYILSAELDHLLVWMLSESPEQAAWIILQSQKFGYAILWGLVSFTLMIFGMQRKERDLRIVSLSLFGLTLVKLFLWDLRGMSELGKTVAFVALGILLMVVSFMYQRLKKILVEKDE
jgi:uncharacterized membrane protein